MATEAEEFGAFRDFLASRPNLVGLAAFLVVFIGVGLLSDSILAAFLAAALGYGAGLILTPVHRQTYSSGIPVRGATREEMEGQLAEVRRRIRSHGAQLPPAAQHDLSVITVHLGEMIDRWDLVQQAPEQRLSIESLVYQYLPSTLDVFLRLPDSAKPAAAPEWTQQLRLLATEVSRSRDTVLKHDLESMRNNGRVLEQKFEDGDLKMFRENGL
ncbi:hypothetical protein [Citricoccus muralis]|uniref:5-bromo-4-chloroindolyl phosphate hydrolysis protein n=1 Tax=Citricoccus muralis TaxID=169134 RepID=A0A3D9LFB7_9MICC|nr:hypothetical protein [Citricoccus muralis]REE05129.1 hypothetical protein C8E99_2996 [Citricoccus muralis]